MDKKLTRRGKSLYTVYKSPAFSEFGKPFDHILKTEDGTEFKVYKQPLSKQSEFFKALFSFNREFEQSETCIHGIQSDILEMILIYLYTGNISLNTENEMPLLFASDFLLIESLKNKCRMFVLQNQTYKNCVKLFLTAYQMKGFNLENQCRRFLLLCFERAIKHSKDKSFDLPYESLLYFLRSKSVNVSGEGFIWSFIESWVQKDPSNRMQNISELLRCLSFNEVDEELASDIVSSPIIQEKKPYKDMEQPFVSNKEKILSYCLGAPFITDVRQPQRVYFVTRGFSERSGVDLFISYDENLDVWRKLRRLGTFNSYKLLTIGHRVYMFQWKLDKLNGIYYKEGVSVYNLMRETNFLIAANYLIVQYVTALGHIYAVNQYGQISQYDEKYCFWEHKTEIQHSMKVKDAVSLNDLIYVMCESSYYGRIMQVYDPSSNSWNLTSPSNIQSERNYPGSVVYQGKIFFFGGLGITNGGYKWLSDAEAYDPIRNEWKVYPKMGFNCSSLSMEFVVVKGRLFAYKRHFNLEVDKKLQLLFEKEKDPWVACWDGSGEWTLNSNCSSLQHVSFCAIEDEVVVRKIMKKNKAAGMPEWKLSGLEEAFSLKFWD